MLQLAVNHDAPILICWVNQRYLNFRNGLCASNDVHGTARCRRVSHDAVLLGKKSIVNATWHSLRFIAVLEVSAAAQAHHWFSALADVA